VASVAPKNKAILSRFKIPKIIMVKDKIIVVAMVMVKVLFALSISPCPRYIAIIVDAPVENNRDAANIKFIKGMDILTAAIAIGPTPWLTNIPSTMVYREKTHIAATDGSRYFKNFC